MVQFLKDLEYGMFSVDVFNLQKALISLRYADFNPTGYFGSLTKQAVKDFQKDNDISQVGRFGPLTRSRMNEMSITNSEWLYNVAKRYIGTDVSPDDYVADAYGCVESINNIVKIALGNPIDYSYATIFLVRSLWSSPLWKEVDESECKRGDIIISVTNSGNGNISNGHVGILSDNGNIMSNSSMTGSFEVNYNLETWKDRYFRLGGMPIHYFHRT